MGSCWMIDRMSSSRWWCSNSSVLVSMIEYCSSTTTRCSSDVCEYGGYCRRVGCLLVIGQLAILMRFFFFFFFFFFSYSVYNSRHRPAHHTAPLLVLAMLGQCVGDLYCILYVLLQLVLVMVVVLVMVDRSIACTARHALAIILYISCTGTCRIMGTY